MKKRTLALILAALFALSSLAALPASAEKKGDWVYFLNDDSTATLCRYFGTATDLAIPREIDGHTVTKLRGWYEDLGMDTVAEHGMIAGTPVERVTIPDTVKIIGDDAFVGCEKLTDVRIPDSVTEICGNAFWGCTALADVTIPDTVTRIHSGAFVGTAFFDDESNWEDGVLYCGRHLLAVKLDYSGTLRIKPGTLTIADWAADGCRSLESLVVPESVTAINYFSFGYCTSLKSVTLPKTLKRIGASAFTSCESLESIAVPDGVTEIGRGAFRYCPIGSFTLPDSVRKIGNYAFEETAFYKNEKNWEDGNLYIGHHLIELRGKVTADYTVKPGTISIADYAFVSGGTIESLTLPEGLAYIGEISLKNCSMMKEIYLPASLEGIGYGAFNGCERLRTVYYAGSEERWKALDVDPGLNEPLLRAKFVFGYPAATPLDFTGDGKINARDVTAFMKALVSPEKPDPATADLTGDGKVNAKDVIALMKYLVANV